MCPVNKWCVCSTTSNLYQCQYNKASSIFLQQAFFLQQAGNRQQEQRVKYSVSWRLFLRMICAAAASFNVSRQREKGCSDPHRSETGSRLSNTAWVSPSPPPSCALGCHCDTCWKQNSLSRATHKMNSLTSSGPEVCRRSYRKQVWLTSAPTAQCFVCS